VVLPDATPLRMGLLDPPQVSVGDWLPYTLLPHFATISMGGSAFTSLGILENGYLFTPSTLRIVNAVEADTGPSLSYENSFLDLVPSLNDYVPDFGWSSDVVQNGRASAYFDIPAGTVSASEVKGSAGDKEIRVIVKIETVGPPVLKVTPFGSDRQAVSFVLDEKAPLVIANSSLSCKDGDGKYDFLLHYLTSRAGLPRSLSQALPGMNSEHGCADPVKALQKLIDAGYPEHIPNPQVSHLSAACSDSRYP
jgi:hypothetical protein